MIRDQLEERGVTDPRVLEAMCSMPRHPFVPDALRRCRLWRPSTSHRPRTDDFAAVYRCDDDPVAGASPGRQDPRDWDRLGLSGRGPHATGAPRVHHRDRRAPCRAGEKTSADARLRSCWAIRTGKSPRSTDRRWREPFSGGGRRWARASWSWGAVASRAFLTSSSEASRRKLPGSVKSRSSS